MKHGSKRNAFTLVELMIVIAIVGVLASVAIPMFQQYVHKAKTSEIMVLLPQLAAAQVSYFQTPRTASDGTPEIACLLAHQPQPPFAQMAGDTRVAWTGSDETNTLGFYPNGDVYANYTSSYLNNIVGSIPVCIGVGSVDIYNDRFAVYSIITGNTASELEFHVIPFTLQADGSLKKGSLRTVYDLFGWGQILAGPLE